MDEFTKNYIAALQTEVRRTQDYVMDLPMTVSPEKYLKAVVAATEAYGALEEFLGSL